VGIVVLGVVCVFVVRALWAHKSPLFVPQNSFLDLVPPRQAITGIIAQSSGEVFQFTRENDGYTPATPGGTLRQGEAIATKQGAVALSFNNAGHVSLKENSELSAASLVADAIMFQQKEGIIFYEVNSITPFSIRALHALFTLNGDATLTIRGTQVMFQVTKGTAKLALVDTDNNTHVWDLVEGNRAFVDDNAREVSVH